MFCLIRLFHCLFVFSVYLSKPTLSVLIFSLCFQSFNGKNIIYTVTITSSSSNLSVSLFVGRVSENAVVGWVLFPLRVGLSMLFFLLMWPVARLRLARLSPEERTKPIEGWRRWLFHPAMVLLSRSVFFSMGFLWIKVKGRQASQKEAPVLVVAPHSGFLDMLVLPVSGLPMVVSRSENAKLPVIGALLEFNQSVLVSRKDPESRRKCVSQIKERLTSDGYWPQMLMFPEGTTTNGKALIKFKPGAFMAGVPVQPVLLHYPNKTDTVRWTWRGNSWMDCLWYTSTQFYSSVTVEFLPVYTPCEQEKQNPELYAQNIQKLMAKALGVPATDYVMEGSFAVCKLGGLSLPVESPARETLRLLTHTGFSRAQVGVVLSRMIDSCCSGQTLITVQQLTSLLGQETHRTAAQILSHYCKVDMMDVRQLCFSLCTAAGFQTPRSILHTAFTLYNRDGDGFMSAGDLSSLMGALVGVPQHDLTEMYTELESRGPTEDALYDLLTTHPAYKKVFGDYLQTASDPNRNGIPNGKTLGHGNGLPHGNSASNMRRD